MLFDYKLVNNVQDVVLDCMCKLVSDIEDEYKNLRRDEMMFIYLPSYMASELAAMLLNDDIGLYMSDDADIDLLEESDEDVLLTVIGNGELHVECARGLSGNFKDLYGSCLAYFYDGYSQKDLRKLTSICENIPVLVFGFEDEFCDEYEDEGFLDLYTDENDDIVGFHVYKETDEGFFGYEFYNSNGMDEDDIYGYLRTIGMM